MSSVKIYTKLQATQRVRLQIKIFIDISSALPSAQILIESSLKAACALCKCIASCKACLMTHHLPIQIYLNFFIPFAFTYIYYEHDLKF